MSIVKLYGKNNSVYNYWVEKGKLWYANTSKIENLPHAQRLLLPRDEGDYLTEKDFSDEYIQNVSQKFSTVNKNDKAIFDADNPKPNYSLSDQNNTGDNDYLAAEENEDMASDENRDIRWSLKSDVEETKNLVAIHNLKPDDLINAFQLGFTPRRNQTM